MTSPRGDGSALRREEGKLRHSARHLLFPHVLGIVRRFLRERVRYHGANRRRSASCATSR